MTNRLRIILSVVLIVGSLGLLYRDVLVKLVGAWTNDGNYSHGFLIPPLALFLVWERRRRLLQMECQPSAFGAVVVVGSLLLFVAGTLGAELFLTRIALLGSIAGTILFIAGWRIVRTLAFPLGILLLMVPFPAIIFNQITFPLQLLASRFGETLITAVNIPVLREGNVLVLANTSLEVAEACSGIRSLISLLTLGIVYGYFTDKRAPVRIVIAALTVPIAIVANGLRVAGTGISAHFFGPEAAQGFFHEFSGWILFIVAFALLVGMQRLVVGLAPRSLPPATEAIAA